ncbi:MAG TPA: 4'-phosphopantetheinyl transferase superfamily protein [Polyangia bacterium]|nr:4'-phosphopantetheinyl transferase superfamily protein [Polyangia bacterium]
MPFEQRFTVRLPFGACVGVALPDSAPPEPDWPLGLHAEERTFARGLSDVRRAFWLGGRVALRAALAAAGRPSAAPILATAQGAPQLPAGSVGSISHKTGLAVAVAAADREPPFTVGVDLELVRPLRADLSGRILTEGERAVLPASGSARDAHLLRVFSAKEAIFKALSPRVGRFIGFREAEIAFQSDGGLTAHLRLSGDEGPFAVELWQLGDLAPAGQIVVVARAVAQNAIG